MTFEPLSFHIAAASAQLQMSLDAESTASSACCIHQPTALGALRSQYLHADGSSIPGPG